MARWAALTLLALAALFSACGGSADGPTAPKALSDAAIADQSLQLVNRARGDEGLSALGADDGLSRIAREHSRAMRDHGFFGHTDPDGTGLRGRLARQGVVFSAAGENLAQVGGTSDPAGAAHEQLLESSEHRRILLDPRFVSAGVGVARDGETVWITQVYLRP